MQSHSKYQQYNDLVAERPLPKKKFAALLEKVRSGELKLADIEVPPPAETRFVATSPHPSGKCPSCKRKAQHFYHYAGGNTKLCIRCIEAGLKA